MNPETFLQNWHKAVEERDLEGLGALIAEDATVASPAFWSPKGPKPYVLSILKAVIEATEGFHYTKEWHDGAEILLEFGAKTGDIDLRGIDKITLNADGKLQHLEVMIRPINALMKLAEFVMSDLSEGKD